MFKVIIFYHLKSYYENCCFIYISISLFNFICKD